MWPLAFAFLSSKDGHSTSNVENSHSSIVMVVSLKLEKAGFRPLLNCNGKRSEQESGIIR